MLYLDWWKDVPGYEGCYQASWNGYIRGLPRIKKNHSKYQFVPGVILSPGRTGKMKYARVEFYRDGRSKTMLVHLLIAITFIGHRPMGFDVCHNDGNTYNNRADNIRYDTRKNNLRDMKKHGTIILGENKKTSKLKNLEVLKIKTMLKENVPIKDIVGVYGVSYVTIHDIKTGRSWGWLKLK